MRFPCHIAKIMVYNFSCNGWNKKKKPDTQLREGNRVFLPSCLDIANNCIILPHRSR